MTQYEVYSYDVFKLLSEYPQAFFPQLSITAVVVDGTLSFIRRNIRNATIIDENGIRSDRSESPMTAVREIILNALIHRLQYPYRRLPDSGHSLQRPPGSRESRRALWQDHNRRTGADRSRYTKPIYRRRA